MQIKNISHKINFNELVFSWKQNSKIKNLIENAFCPQNILWIRQKTTTKKCVIFILLFNILQTSCHLTRKKNHRQWQIIWKFFPSSLCKHLQTAWLQQMVKQRKNWRCYMLSTMHANSESICLMHVIYSFQIWDFAS